ncbi:MAG: RNA-guided pseudouridylation complex pseudouridine synthase subunit Cbf5 [Methermicoccaceae archaeon]
MERKLLHKIGAESDPAHGCRPVARPIEDYLRMGVVNIDKPAGPTSHEVSAWIRDMLHLQRAAHVGTLDPHVSGVQPTVLGDATRAALALSRVDKEYVCLMELHRSVPTSVVEELLREFTGGIYQMPPLKSAVKRQLRVRTIHYINLLEHEDRMVLFKVGCEAGTYIRKLCYDMGEVLGFGAHMRELRRTKCGQFTERSLFTLHQLKDACVLYEESEDSSELRTLVRPIEEVLTYLPSIYIKDSAVDALCRGAALAAPGVVSVDASMSVDDLVAVYTLKGEVVALANAKMDAEGALEARNGVVATPRSVLMTPDTYPKGWVSKRERERTEED